MHRCDTPFRGPAITGDPPTSLTLLDRLRADDQAAWTRLVRLYGPLVEHWCRRAGAGAAAEDIRQEVFQAVAGGLAAFRRDRPGDTFRGWLRGITRNKIREHYRAASNGPTAAGGTDALMAVNGLADPLAEDPSRPEPDDAEELAGLYRRGLDIVRSEFEPRTWEAFWRSAVDGRETADVAADLGITPAAVRKAKSRVLNRLRQEVGDAID